MKPITLTSVVFAAATQFLGVLAATATSSAPTQTPSTLPVLNELTSHGCYSSGGNFTKESSVDHVSSGSCGDYCTEKGFWVMGLHGSTCYCGYVYPPEDDVAADSKCNYPCPGYGLEACGGISGDYYSVFNTGIEVAVDDYEPPVTSTSSAVSKPTTSTTSIESSVATESAEPTETSTPKKKSTNTAAIAAGVVVGVVAVAAGIGAFFFFIRRRRNAEIEEEHRRNAAVNAFINGSKPPSSSGSISMTDSRLDPVMAHRRLSDGSIADNQDYSRRILRVTNA